MLLAIALLLVAQSPPEIVTPPPFRNEGKAGNLMALQLWTDKPDEFLSAWHQPTPPDLKVTTKVARNKPITSFIVFAGCKGDAAGNCKLVANIRFLDPDGEPYGEHKDVEVFTGEAVDGYNLRLSPASPSMVIEDGEKLGAYTVRIAVTDRNANVTAITEETVTVVEAEAKAK